MVREDFENQFDLKGHLLKTVFNIIVNLGESWTMDSNLVHCLLTFLINLFKDYETKAWLETGLQCESDQNNYWYTLLYL
jgi:hypothetical protein